VRTDQVIRSKKKITSLPHRSSYPFEKNCLLCTRVKPSVQKKLGAVQTDQGIRSKIIIRAISYGYLFENNYPAIHFEGLVN